MISDSSTVREAPCPLWPSFPREGLFAGVVYSWMELRQIIVPQTNLDGCGENGTFRLRGSVPLIPSYWGQTESKVIYYLLAWHVVPWQICLAGSCWKWDVGVDGPLIWFPMAPVLFVCGLRNWFIDQPSAVGHMQPTTSFLRRDMFPANVS